MGEIWTRPGLDRRTRSCITLAMLATLGHEHELAMHVRAARRIGLTEDEIKEVLLQTAIYAGVAGGQPGVRGGAGGAGVRPERGGPAWSNRLTVVPTTCSPWPGGSP
ncbi:carboxymuconolactone decarboxylase family protein [Streptosporangium lutulentum]